jgi:hypothetical protein
MIIGLKCKFIDDEIGTDQVCMNGIGIESGSDRKYSVMDKKVGFPTSTPSSIFSFQQVSPATFFKKLS